MRLLWASVSSSIEGSDLTSLTEMSSQMCRMAELNEMKAKVTVPLKCKDSLEQGSCLRQRHLGLPVHYITFTHTHTQVSLCPRGDMSHKELYSLSFDHAECLLLCYLCEALLMKTDLSLPGVGSPGLLHIDIPLPITHTHSFFLSSLLLPHHLLHLSPHQPSTGFK